MSKDLLPSILFFVGAVAYGVYEAKRKNRAEKQRRRAEHEAAMKFEPLDRVPFFAIGPEAVAGAVERKVGPVPAIPVTGPADRQARQAPPKTKNTPMVDIPKVDPEEEARRERWRRAFIDSEILRRKY